MYRPYTVQAKQSTKFKCFQRGITGIGRRARVSALMSECVSPYGSILAQVAAGRVERTETPEKLLRIVIRRD